MKQVNVLGYGLMGKQIAALFYLGGFNVTIWNHREVDEKDLVRQIKLLRRSIDDVEEGMYNIINDINLLPDAITIESLAENIELKKAVYKKCEHFKAPYFTNSSSYSPLEIGDNVNGFHFFNPISLKLVELYWEDSAISDQVVALTDFLKKTGFDVVKVGSNRGYLGNYILFNEISSALKLIEKLNYSTEQVNSIYEKLYGGRNIFNIVDLIGVDTSYQILKNLKESDNSIYLPECFEAALAKNILGRKNKTSIIDVL